MNNDLQALAAKSEKQQFNKVAIICQTILDSVIAAAYILEVVKGNRTLTYGLITVLLCYVPVIWAFLVYKKNPESPNALMRIVGGGFSILYTFVLFTANNDLVFTYVMPMLIILLVFNVKSFIYIIGAGAFLENVISVVINVTVHNRTAAEDIVTYEIQLFLVLLCVALFIAISHQLMLSGDIRSARLTLEKNKINDILDRVLEISKLMTENVEKVDEKMITLNASMDNTINSMSEVTTGTNESAEAIQNQLVKTEQIQDSIESVEKVVDSISEEVSRAVSAVEDGNKRVDNLTKLSNDADRAGEEASQALKAFTEYTNKMNSITELINNVASQTSLLALNASIEAARAGEAGRGFAVVASEISNLAGQTTGATADINDLIANITEQLEMVVNKIDILVETNIEQGKTAEKTANSFDEINSNISLIKEQTHQLNGVVSSLAGANKEIVDSIQTISAITEEVSAHSGETYSASEANQNILNEVGNLVEELKAEAGNLNEAGLE